MKADLYILRAERKGF